MKSAQNLMEMVDGTPEFMDEFQECLAAFQPFADHLPKWREQFWTGSTDALELGVKASLTDVWQTSKKPDLLVKLLDLVQSLGQDDLAASIKCDIDGLAHKDSLEKFRGVVTHVCQAMLFDWQLVRDFLASYRKVTNDKSPEQFTDLSPGLYNVFEKILELWSKTAVGSEKEIIATADYEQACQVLDALLLQEGIAAQACMSTEAFAKDGKEFQAMMMAVPFFLLCAFCIVACTLLLFTHLAFVHDCYPFAACAFPCEIGVALRICVFCAVRFF